MKNAIQKGNVLNYPVPAATTITSGQPVFVGALAGIAAITSAIEGAIVPVNLEGVFVLPKTAPLVITQGDRLYWDTTPGEVTKTALGNTFIGVAFESQLSADTEVLVQLRNEGSVGVPSSLIALVDNSGGGAADGTIGAITAGTPADLAAQAAINTQIRDAIKELATAHNSLLAAIK